MYIDSMYIETLSYVATLGTKLTGRINEVVIFAVMQSGLMLTLFFLKFCSNLWFHTYVIIIH